MASGKGTVTIDFGAWPGSQEANITFTDATISAGSKVEAYVMANGSIGSHSANDHRYLPAFAIFTAEPIAATGGTIYGNTLPGSGVTPNANKLVGQWKIEYVWSD